MAWKISRRVSERGLVTGLTLHSSEGTRNALRTGASAAPASLAGAEMNKSPSAITNRLLTIATMSLRVFLLVGHAVDVLEHLIRCLHDLRVGLIGALRHDHLDELVYHVDVGVFQHALLQSA